MAEIGALLRRYTVNNRIEGSNPSVSASKSEPQRNWGSFFARGPRCAALRAVAAFSVWGKSRIAAPMERQFAGFLKRHFRQLGFCEPVVTSTVTSTVTRIGSAQSQQGPLLRPVFGQRQDSHQSHGSELTGMLATRDALHDVWRHEGQVDDPAHPRRTDTYFRGTVNLTSLK